MYKGIGDASYNDGLFSQAAPYQAYQASVSQFGDGGLGAVSRLVSSRPFHQVRRPRASPRLFGARSTAGFGSVYNSGVLGDASSIVPSSVLPVTQDNLNTVSNNIDAKITATTKAGILWAGALTLAVGYLYLKR